MPCDKFEQMAGEIYKWWPLLVQLANEAGQPKTPPGPSGPVSAWSPVEKATTMRASIDKLESRLTALAAEAHTAHSGEEAPMPERHPALVLHSLASWIGRQPFAQDMCDEVTRIHGAVARLAGYAPDRADAACPCCRIDYGQAAPRMIRTPARTGLPDLYTCPRCGYAGIIERSGPWNNNTPVNTLAVTMRLRVQEALEASQEWVTGAEASKLVGIKASTIRTWKQRGKIATDDEGRVVLGEVAKLAHKTQ